MKRSLSLLFALLALYPAVWAQTTISGKLIDATDQTPIEYATVAIYSLPDSSLAGGGVTDVEGNFSVKDLPKGSYSLLAQFLGYDKKWVSGIELENGQQLNLGILSLAAGQQLLDELEVRGEQSTSYHTIDRQVYRAGEFQSAQGGTATDIVRNMPSVSIDAQGELRVRGSAGFVVLLDGKPIQTDAATVLNQLPANAVDNIELITAPSAKYDPEGKGGIINIITKKGATDGLYLQVNTRLGMPSIEDYDNPDNTPRYGGDFVLNYRKGKWDFSLGGSYLRYDISGRREGDVFTIIGDTLTQFPSDGERSFDEINFSGRFTLGFNPDKKNAFSLGFYGGERTKDRTADILYYDNHAIFQPTGQRAYTLQYFNENLRVRRGDFVLGSFDYSHQFDDQSTLSTSVLYEYTMLGGPTTNINLSWPSLGDTLQDQFNTNDNPLHGFRYQLDYARPLGGGKLETGYQYRNLDHTGEFIYEERIIGTDEWVLIPDFSSTVDLRREIHSVYGQYSAERGKWSYSAGIRAEYMDRELLLRNQTVDTTYFYDFLKLFPSASLQYKVSDDLLFKAAYSKRVERTTTFKMNPFPEREHSETMEQGDPELLPEFIDVVEAGVVKNFGDHSVFATAYYRHVQNVVNRVNNVFNDTILNRIYSNVGNSNAYGLEMGVELTPTDNWKVFAGGNLYRYSIDGTFDNRPVSTSSWIYSINANTTVDISPTFSLQWQLNYLSERITAQGEDSRFLSPNLTLRKTFLDNRLAATVQWLNMDAGLLPTNEQRITTRREGEFFTTTNYVYEVDVIMLNFTYNLNRSGKKAKFIKSEFGEKEF